MTSFSSLSSANEYYLYALGGRDETAVLGSYEFSLVTVTPQNGLARETQSMAAWTQVNGGMTAARMGLGSVVTESREILGMRTSCITDFDLLIALSPPIIYSLADDDKYYLFVSVGLDTAGLGQDTSEVAEIVDGQITFLEIRRGSSANTLGWAGRGYCLSTYLGQNAGLVLYGGGNGQNGELEVDSPCSPGSAACLDRTVANVGNTLTGNVPNALSDLRCAQYHFVTSLSLSPHNAVRTPS